jgi:hypothetical protein
MWKYALYFCLHYRYIIEHLFFTRSRMPSDQDGLFLFYSKICPILFLFIYFLHLSVFLWYHIFQLSDLIKAAVISECAFLLPFICFLSVLCKTISVSKIIWSWWQMKETLVWSVGGMSLMGENKNSQSEKCLNTNLSAPKSMCAGLRSKMGSW